MVDSLQLKLAQGSTVSDVLTTLEIPEDLEIVLAINDQLCTKTSSLQDRDRLAIIPAVAGGVA